VEVLGSSRSQTILCASRVCEFLGGNEFDKVRMCVAVQFENMLIRLDNVEHMGHSCLGNTVKVGNRKK